MRSSLICRGSEPVPAHDDWMLRWNERNAAVRRILGETVPPNIVHSFSWKTHVLPGACCLTFKDASVNECHLHMTLGLTQPLHRSDPAYPWEFSIRAKGMAEWPVDLLYQLVTQWLCEEGQIGFGYHLPLIFFIGSDGNQWASISDRVFNHPIVGSIRGLYLWTDHTQGPFQISTGEFSLLNVVAVTVPAGHRMRLSIVGAQPQWGMPARGIEQYESLQTLPDAAFTNGRQL